MNKGKHVCAVSGRSIASLHITWRKELSYAARQFPTILFKTSVYQYGRPAPIVPTLTEGSVDSCSSTSDSARLGKTFSVLPGGPQGTDYRGELSKNPRSLPRCYQHRCTIAMYSNCLRPRYQRGLNFCSLTLRTEHSLLRIFDKKHTRYLSISPLGPHGLTGQNRSSGL